MYLRVLGRLAAAQPDQPAEDLENDQVQQTEDTGRDHASTPRRHQPLIKAHVSSSEAVQGYGRP
jgi:hypothetical protein